MVILTAPQPVRYLASGDDKKLWSTPWRSPPLAHKNVQLMLGLIGVLGRLVAMLRCAASATVVRVAEGQFVVAHELPRQPEEGLLGLV